MIVDLFAGPGGWECGLEQISDAYCVGIEFDKWAVSTRSAVGLPTIRGDVASLELKIGHLDGLIASPPCQTFSQAGRRTGLDQMEHVLEVLAGKAQPKFTDPRTALILEPLRWIRRHQPNWVALEQVRTVLPVWELYSDLLRQDGYSTWVGVLNAADYGVPQTRKRCILTASRHLQVSKPEPTHEKNHDSLSPLVALPGLGSSLKPWVTMAEALGWGATVRPGWTVPSHSNGGGPDGFGGSGARGAANAERDAGRWVLKERQAHGAVRRIDEPAMTITSSADNGNFQWAHQRPSTTIVGSFAPDKVAPPTYRKAGDGPRQNQPGAISITVEDALVLQSFPRDYPLQGPKTKKFEQVGNAIPPTLAAAVLNSVGINGTN